MSKETLRIHCSNGHLGFAPTKEESFWIGAKTLPDYYCCDSGSDDIGPVPLGTNKCASHPNHQKHDLELMLLASREQGVPMIIGSFVSVLSGSLVIEQIFSVPGVGELYVRSIQQLDYDVFMVDSIFYSFVGLLAGIVVDLSYGFIDPRIRMGAN